MRWSASAALRLAQQRMPRRGRPPGLCPGSPAAIKWVLFSDPLVSSPSSSQAPPQNGPGTVSYPARRFLHTQDWRRLPSLHRCCTHLVNGHHPKGWTSYLFSFQLRPELGGALLRAGYTPGDHLTSWMYFTTFVQYLYRSCYLSDNKPVLLYLLLRLLPQYKTMIT
jgi:hypothetical protein